MKIGMPTLLEFRTLEENIMLCRRLELDFIELNMNLPIYLPESLSSAGLKQLQRESEIGFTVHLPEELEFTSFQPSIRQGHITRCLEAMEWAMQAGIQVLNMHFHPGIYFTLPDRKVWINERYEAEFVSMLDDAFGTLYERAAALGVKLCIENTCNFHIPFIRRALERLSASAQFHLTWDVGHDAKAGFKETQVFEALTERIRHMHLHDCDGQSDHQPLFSGQVPIQERMELAEKRQLSVVVEVKTSDALAASIGRLRAEGIWRQLRGGND